MISVCMFDTLQTLSKVGSCFRDKVSLHRVKTRTTSDKFAQYVFIISTWGDNHIEPWLYMTIFLLPTVIVAAATIKKTRIYIYIYIYTYTSRLMVARHFKKKKTCGSSEGSLSWVLQRSWIMMIYGAHGKSKFFIREKNVLPVLR